MTSDLKRKFKTLTAIIAIPFLLVACGDSTSSKQAKNSIDYTQHYPAENGGTLIDAMTGEPSGLLAMIAGESAASAIAGNIFNSFVEI